MQNPVDEVLRALVTGLPYVPSFCRPEFLAFYAKCTPGTPSHNELRKMHFAAYKRLREAYAWQLRAALGKQPAPKVPQSAVVYVRRMGTSGLDWDNVYGGLKPLQDCLVAPSKRAPNGLHIIQDDSPRHMPVPPLVVQKPAPPNQSSVEVFVFDISALALQDSG